MTFVLRYKQDNDQHWKNDTLRNVCKNNNLCEYRVEYTVLNAKPGRYVCQIQSKCEFGVSELSMETPICEKDEVG